MEKVRRVSDKELISVRVPKMLGLEFKLACAEAGESQTEVICDAIEAYLSHFPRKADFCTILSDESLAKLEDRAKREHMTPTQLACSIIDFWLEENT